MVEEVGLGLRRTMSWLFWEVNVGSRVRVDADFRAVVRASVSSESVRPNRGDERRKALNGC